MKNSFKEMLESPYKNADDFDNAHKLACTKFLKLLAEKTEQESEKIHNLYYGKAQKFINMTFKYLLASDRYDEKVFSWCHMPLDVYTMHWFYHETSSIKEDVYYEVQKIIRSRIQLKKNELSVLQNEFLIWEKEKGAVKKCAVLTCDDLRDVPR